MNVPYPSTSYYNISSKPKGIKVIKKRSDSDVRDRMVELNCIYLESEYRAVSEDIIRWFSIEMYLSVYYLSYFADTRCIVIVQVTMQIT
jgi:hypothetical protein